MSPCLNSELLSERCEDNHLSRSENGTPIHTINAARSKEVIVDFMNNPAAVSPVVIDVQTAEVLSQCRYLGTLSDSKLTFEPQTDAVC